MTTAILSNVNIDLLSKFLKRDGFEGEYYIAGYNQYAQEILNFSSGLYQANSSQILLHLEGGSLFEDVFSSADLMEEADSRKVIESRAEEIWNLVSVLSQQASNSNIIINTVAAPTNSVMGFVEQNAKFLSAREAVYIFNLLLKKKKNEGCLSNVFIVDWEKEVFLTGFNNIYDARYWYIGRIPYSNDGFQSLASLYGNFIKTITSPQKKVLVLDCDNTLWGGIVGEDGLSHIQLSEDGVGKAYRDFQRMIKRLKQKGVLLCVASKNKEADVLEVFSSHNLMILKESDFVAMKINWQDKVANIMEIAKELNLGLDSFVFLDDSPYEREAVKSGAPEVAVPDFPEDPAFLTHWFSSVANTYFNKVALTQEDAVRSDFYKSEKQRSQLNAQAKTLEEFYQNLNMHMIVQKNDKTHLNRLTQLTQRTNQFNLTTKRYAFSEMESLVEDENYDVWNLELIDKFGTNGIVGLAIVHREQPKLFVETFLMSCRIIGRGVEDAFMGYISSYYQKENWDEMIGMYISTKKNQLAKDFYPRIGFLNERVHNDDAFQWQFDLRQSSIAIPSYINIEDTHGVFA